eukprot:gene484-264_t
MVWLCVPRRRNGGTTRVTATALCSATSLCGPREELVFFVRDNIGCCTTGSASGTAQCKANATHLTYRKAVKNEEKGWSAILLEVQADDPACGSVEAFITLPRPIKFSAGYNFISQRNQGMAQNEPLATVAGETNLVKFLWNCSDGVYTIQFLKLLHWNPGQTMNLNENMKVRIFGGYDTEKSKGKPTSQFLTTVNPKGMECSHHRAAGHINLVKFLWNCSDGVYTIQFLKLLHWNPGQTMNLNENMKVRIFGGYDTEKSKGKPTSQFLTTVNPKGMECSHHRAAGHINLVKFLWNCSDGVYMIQFLKLLHWNPGVNPWKGGTAHHPSKIKKKKSKR